MTSFRYGISAIQYDVDRRLIINVQAHRLSADDKLSALGVYPREAVISAIEEKGLTLVTLPSAFDGKYTVGVQVIVVEIQDEKFLKTTNDEQPKDSLGTLPQF